MSWSLLESGAPTLARLGRTRIEQPRVAMLGTVRKDGSPRVSPVGPAFAGGELLIGVMPRSGKARDLRRDPRCALQSLVSGPEAGDPELKLYGRVVPSDVETDWWEGRAERADVYALAVEQALYVEWDLAAGVMRIRRWSPGAGESLAEQAYP